MVFNRQSLVFSERGQLSRNATWNECCMNDLQSHNSNHGTMNAESTRTTFCHEIIAYQIPKICLCNCCGYCDPLFKEVRVFIEME